MQYKLMITGAALLAAVPGFSKLIEEEYRIGSDVAAESAVDEVKSIPADTGALAGEVVRFTTDETKGAINSVRSLTNGDPHAEASDAGKAAVDAAWRTSGDVIFRSYAVSDKIGDLLLSSASDTDASSIDVSAFFKSVQFTKGTSAHYLPKFKSLFVHQTLEQLLMIERVLGSYQREQRSLMGHQVEIETKFVEVSQSSLNELGFSWYFNSKNGGGLKILDDLSLDPGQSLLAGGLRTASQAISAGTDAGVLAVSKASGSLQWDAYITALEQTDDADVLSAPRVVTLDGYTATIQVGHQQMLPRSFISPNNETSAFVEHRDWESELIGVSLEVTPDIRDEGLIDLYLHPVIMDLNGYDTYQVTPDNMDAAQVATDLPPVYASIPFVRIREIETNVTVADGSTVGMGGLIYNKVETFRDKVPLLGSIPYIGRLFRSEGERSTKRNLMIFVTATQVDVDGRRAADLVLEN